MYANITYHTPKINIQRVGILALFPVMIEDNSDQTSNLVSYRLIFKLSSISTGNKRYYEISKYGCNQPNNVREHQVCKHKCNVDHSAQIHILCKLKMFHTDRQSYYRCILVSQYSLCKVIARICLQRLIIKPGECGRIRPTCHINDLWQRNTFTLCC